MTRILVNYGAEDKNYLPKLNKLLKLQGLQAVGSATDYGIESLQRAASKAGAAGIYIVNERTLCACVDAHRKANEKDSPLAKWRGSRLNFTIPAIVGAPLNHLVRVPYGEFVAQKDLEKFKFLKDKPVQFNFKVCETLDDFEEVTSLLEKALLISVDIETDASPKITCISYTGLYWNGHWETKSWVIPFFDFGVDHWIDPFLHQEAILTMRKINKNPVPKLFFNGLYDAQYLIRYNAEPENYVLDGMGLAYCEFSELPKTLDFVTSLRCYDYYYWKGGADEARKKKDIFGFWTYNARDSWWLLRSFLYQLEQAPRYTFKNYQIQFKYTYPSLYCAFEGFKVNQPILEKVKSEYEVLRNQSLRNLQTMCADSEFNPSSPKQVARLFYDLLGAKPPKDFKGNPVRGTGEKILGKLAPQHPIIAKFVFEILKYRETAKAISTYMEFEQINGRLLYSISPWGTDTARMASKKSSFWVGTQIQNIPQYAKTYLEADTNYILIEPDNNKSEARCVAFCSNSAKMIDALENKDKDFYKQLGSLFFGIPYEEVTKELRNKVIKRIVHGTNYMMQEDTFIDVVGIPQMFEAAALLGITIDSESPPIEGKRYQSLKQFAKYLLGLYFKPFPEVPEWYKEVKQEILRTQKLVSVLGWTRFFFADITKDTGAFRSAVAHVPQNLSVQILNKGWWKLYKLTLESKGEFRIKAQIHDSCPSQCVIAKQEYYAQKMMELLTLPVVIKGKTMVIPVDSKSAVIWADMKE